MKILIAGCGGMAVEYYRILSSMNIESIVVGRGEGSAATFYNESGVQPIMGGVGAYCEAGGEIPETAIVAVSVDRLAEVSTALIRAGCRKLLVEKPGGATFDEIEKLAEISEKHASKVFLGYNRRFYPSVLKARKIIEEDGGVLSYHFEFTEWAHRIEPIDMPSIIKNNWFLANSTHVVDLAFRLGGLPVEMSSFTQGELSWHKPVNFAGAGKTKDGALFTYKANWNAPGRWGLEVLTGKRRLILQPLEELKVIEKGSVAINPVALDEDPEDKKFKPGLFRQLAAFINNDDDLPSISEHTRSLDFFRKISGKTTSDNN